MPRRSVRPYVLDYLHECNARDGDLAFADIRLAGGCVLATLCVGTRACTFDYMDADPGVRRVCKAIAEDLREVAGRSVYFDLARGTLRIST